MLQKYFYAMTLLAAAITNPLLADINTTQVLKDKPQSELVKEGIVIPVPELELQDKWTLAYGQIAPDGSWILEWIPKNENVNSWSELIQIQFFPAEAFQDRINNAATFADLFIQSLKQKFPEVSSKTTKATDDNVFIEWSLPNPALGEAAQNELVQLIMTKAGIYRVAFTKKVPEIASDLKTTWKERLSRIQVNQNQDQHQSNKTTQ